MEKALVGYGGHAKEVSSQIGLNLKCFVEPKHMIKGTHSLSEFDPEKFEVIIAVGDPQLREELIKKLPSNTKFFTFIHPTTQIMSKDVEIGEGSFIGANSIITTNVKIGKHSILNRGCQIGHDTVCGDFLSMMPGSIISGNCKIGDKVYLGTNSSIREKINICSNVTIGLNGGVINDIKEEGIYVGLPVKKVTNRKNATYY